MELKERLEKIHEKEMDFKKSCMYVERLKSVFENNSEENEGEKKFKNEIIKIFLEENNALLLDKNFFETLNDFLINKNLTHVEVLMMSLKLGKYIRAENIIKNNFYNREIFLIEDKQGISSFSVYDIRDFLFKKIIKNNYKDFNETIEGMIKKHFKQADAQKKIDEVEEEIKKNSIF